jgi:capsular exopolysaccharide synthesis family protein
MLQTFLLISLTVIVGTSQLPSVYESKTVLLFETQSSITESFLLANIGMIDNPGSISKPSVNSIENNVEIATSDLILNKVISNLQLSNNKGQLLEPDEILSTSIIAKFDPPPSIKVEAVTDTDLFEIVARSTDPEEAAMIANTLAEACIQNNLKEKKQEYKNAKTLVQDQIESVRSKYLTALMEMKTFSNEQQSLDISLETNNTINRISALMVDKEEAILDISQIRTRINELKKQLNQQDQETILSTTSDENSYISELRDTIIEYEMKIEETLVEKKKDHPDVQILIRQLKKAKAELNREIALSKDYATALLTQKRDYAASKSRLKALDKEIGKHMKDFSSVSEKIFKEAQLNLNIKINQDLYQSILEYLYQIRIGEIIILPDIRVIEKASVPDLGKPQSPKKVVNFIVGLFLGGLFGFLMGFLTDYLDDTIKTKKDLEKVGATLLGTIPKVKKKDGILILNKPPKDPLVEAYRSIRNSIKFASLDKPVRSLVITSSITDAGKTTMVSNLAISMAQEGKNVLLLDMDYRQPMIHSVFGLQNHEGGTNVLSQQNNAEEVIQHTDIRNLNILSSGPVPLDPGKLIESNKVKELIEALSARFDIVLIDTPPILVVDDAIVLADIVDEFIIVVESGKETNTVFKQVQERLSFSKISPIGVILNKVQIGRGKDNYGYYYQG